MKEQFSIYDKIKEYSIFFCIDIKDNQIIRCDISSPNNFLPSLKEIKMSIKYLKTIYDKLGIKGIQRHNRNSLKILKDLKKGQTKRKIQEIKNNSGYIYVIKADKFYKIGKAEEPKQRIESFATGCPFKIKTILCKPVENYAKIEIFLHKKFKEKHYRSEWFILDKNDILKIKVFLDKYKIKRL